MVSYSFTVTVRVRVDFRHLELVLEFRHSCVPTVGTLTGVQTLELTALDVLRVPSVKTPIRVPSVATSV